MNSADLDAYMGKVNRHLLGLPSNARAGILAELRDHLDSQFAQRGAALPEMFESGISKLEPPRKVAKRYKKLYGYSLAFKILFAIAGVLLGIATIPVWEIAAPGYNSTLAFILLLAYLYWVGTRAGKRMGLAVGALAAMTRLFLLAIIAAALSGQGFVDGGPAFAYFLTSLMLVFIGYVPGEARKRWKDRGQVEFE